MTFEIIFLKINIKLYYNHKINNIILKQYIVFFYLQLLLPPHISMKCVKVLYEIFNNITKLTLESRDSGKNKKENVQLFFGFEELN